MMRLYRKDVSAKWHGLNARDTGRLPRRVFNSKQNSYSVVTELAPVKNPAGRVCSWALPWMILCETTSVSGGTEELNMNPNTSVHGGGGVEAGCASSGPCGV